MCAIVDANVANEVFGPHPTPAGEKFLDWVDGGSHRLVVGGKLLGELAKSSQDFRKWMSRAMRTGKMKVLDKNKVSTRTDRIEQERLHKSNDPHVLALAQLSGARLLYSNDAKLQQDFKNKDLIDRPQGNIYSTRQNKNFTRTHKRLLSKQDLCKT